MLILNFSHPFTKQQRAQIIELAGIPDVEIRTIPVQIDQNSPLEVQVRTIVDSVGLTSEEWQTSELLINPPGRLRPCCLRSPGRTARAHRAFPNPGAFASTFRSHYHV